MNAKKAQVTVVQRTERPAGARRFQRPEKSREVGVRAVSKKSHAK